MVGWVKTRGDGPGGEKTQKEGGGSQEEAREGRGEGGNQAGEGRAA